MDNTSFLIAGYVIVLGGLAAYALSLVKRIKSARRAAGDAASTDPQNQEQSGGL